MARIIKYPKIEATIKTGEENFYSSSEKKAFTLKEFWQWSASDLVSNATRGMLAEFIVAKALGIELNKPREEWATWDLTTPDDIKIEVKCSGFLQTWGQPDYSKIKFSIEKTRAWDENKGIYEGEKKRHAQIYVFCIFKTQDQNIVDPLDLDQWQFFVIPTQDIEKKHPNDESINENGLKIMGFEGISFEQLHEKVILLTKKMKS